MIVYEFPLTEHIRTLLKLERLFLQALQLIRQEDCQSHQTALLSLLQLIEMACRSEIKTDLQADLVRLQTHLNGINVDTAHITELLSSLHAISGRFDQLLRDHDWLAAIKQRANIVGGINEFDIPYYHYWQHRPSAQRKADLISWVTPMLPLHVAITLVLKHLRQANSPEAHIATAGFFQQMLSNRSGHLLRVGLAKDELLVPEISANRYAIHIRFLSTQLTPMVRCEQDVEFQLCFCTQ